MAFLATKGRVRGVVFLGGCALGLARLAWRLRGRLGWPGDLLGLLFGLISRLVDMQVRAIPERGMVI